MNPIRLAAFSALFAAPLSVLAAPQGGGHHRRPPVEALQACEDQEEQATCSFATDDETVEGVCMPGPRPDLPLACRPDRQSRPDRESNADRGSQPERRGPPPEALQACVSLDLDDSCAFSHRDRDVEGVCATARESDELVCRPERRR